MSYTVVPLQIDKHREALLQLWKGNFDDYRGKDCAGERLSWLCQESPADSAWTWVGVEIESNAVVGCGSVIRANKYIGGRVVTAGIPVLFAVEKKHRTAAAALAIQRAVTQESFRIGFDFLAGQPNKKALPIFDRVGYRTIGEAQRWAKSTGRGAGLTAYPDCSLYTDEVVTVADSRFEELWRRGRSQHHIIGEKTTAFLNWRYAAFKEQDYRFYCLFRSRDNQLMGYLVYSAEDWGFFIADLFCEDAQGPVLDNLLRGFASLANREEQEWIALSYLGEHWFEDRLAQLGFAPNRNRRKLLVCADPRLPDAYRREILDKKNWFIFGGEMDLF